MEDGREPVCGTDDADEDKDSGAAVLLTICGCLGPLEGEKCCDQAFIAFGGALLVTVSQGGDSALRFCPALSLCGDAGV